MAVMKVKGQLEASPAHKGGHSMRSGVYEATGHRLAYDYLCLAAYQSLLVWRLKAPRAGRTWWWGRRARACPGSTGPRPRQSPSSHTDHER